MGMPSLLLSLSLLVSVANARAQERAEPETDRTLDRAGDIVAQPARDIGIDAKEIPDVLQAAARDPYAVPSSRRCAELQGQYAALNQALGADFAAVSPGEEDKAGRLAEAGGSAIVNSLIPFRGIVREVSGAAETDRRREAAIAAGHARRGFLRGLASARNCRLAG